MSGICGLFRFDDEKLHDRDLDRMVGALAHRGPDRQRSYKTERVGLGHLLMRVTQEDLLDRQPLNVSGVALVADLRLDNREELGERLDIPAEELAALPDSDLLHRAYLRWDEACVEQLIGDFAFALWDARENKLVLGRDHMGQRQIYYHRGGEFFAFATEPKALLALADVPRVFSERHLAANLFRRPGPYGFRQGRTLFEGIYSLEAATVMSVAVDGSTASRRYWEPHADPAQENRDEAYYIDAYRRIVGEAVTCRLRRTLKPAGLFLSGGLGSAAIAGLAGPVVNAQQRKLIAVSSVMPIAPGGTKCRARRWVEICERDMSHLTVRYATAEGRNALTGLDRAFLGLDRMVGDNHYVTEEMFELVAAAGARVVMDGYGDDYHVNPRGQMTLIYLLRTRQWRRFLSEFVAWRRLRPRSLLGTIKDDIVYWMFPRVGWAWRRWRTGRPPFGPELPIARDFARRALATDMVPRGRLLGSALRSTRESMLRVSRRVQDGPPAWAIPAALHGLEFTQPFHDKRVVEFGLAIPEELFVKNGRPRYLARTALADVYPPEFQDRLPSGEGIGPDFRRMAESIQPYVLAEIDRMEKAGRLSRYFDFPRMRRMITSYPRGTVYSAKMGLRAFMYARYVEWFRGHNR